MNWIYQDKLKQEKNPDLIEREKISNRISFRSNSGFVITLDAFFAMVTVIFILFLSLNYLNLSKSSRNSEISAMRTATDLIAILDYENVLDSMDKGTIENRVNSLLPQNLKISIKINLYDDSEVIEQIQINEDIKDNFFIGKWIFIVDNKFGLVRYKVAFR